MKLLFDENLSHHLVGMLEILFPGSVHVRDVGLALLEGPPPKVVWIRVGNCTTATVDALLRAHHEELAAFAVDVEAALIVLP